jgi:hypothetical protein
MNIRLTSIIALVSAAFNMAYGQVPEPAMEQQEPLVLINGIAHIGNGQLIENSIIAIVNGKISTVADARNSKFDLSGFKVINIGRKHVYPGLIMPNSIVGLEDISAVRASSDFEEVGLISPNVRSLISYNTDSEIIPTLRYNGILLAQVVPEGDLVAGRSSIMKMDGWNWEDAAYKIDDGLHINWPKTTKAPSWWLGETQEKPNENYDEYYKDIEQLLEDARSYMVLEKAEKKNLKLEAMIPILKGSASVFIHADGVNEIIDGCSLFLMHGIGNIVIVGGSDAWYARQFLKEHDIPVILEKLHRLPDRPEEDVDLPYKLPFLLDQEGILVGLSYRNELQSSRNLPFLAGTAAAYGLGKEEALKLVTINNARILGIEETTGTLEVGKDANIVVSEGDLMDMRTNQIGMAFIQGRQLNLEGKQQMLYKRYKDKYQLED